MRDLEGAAAAAAAWAAAWAAHGRRHGRYSVVAPKWFLHPDPAVRDELRAVSTCSSSASPLAGKRTSTPAALGARASPSCVHQLTARIYAARTVPSDENGLADLRQGAPRQRPRRDAHGAGVLNPVFYEPLVLSARMPTTQPRGRLFPSTRPVADGPRPDSTRSRSTSPSAAHLPPGRFDRSIREYYNKPSAMVAPEWVEQPTRRRPTSTSASAGGGAAAAARRRARARPAGRAAGCSVRSAAPRTTSTASARGKASAPLAAPPPRRAPAGRRRRGPSRLGARAAGRERGGGGGVLRADEPYLVEISVVGCRDMVPREILGVPIEFQALHVEFEYGQRYAENRVTRSRVAYAAAAADGGDGSSSGALVRSGPHINMLETLYIKVELPVDVELYAPMMGVRVRESSRHRLGGLSSDPIMGIAAINLVEEMPSYQAKLREASAEAAAQRAKEEHDERQRRLDASPGTAAAAAAGGASGGGHDGVADPTARRVWRIRRRLVEARQPRLGERDDARRDGVHLRAAARRRAPARSRGAPIW